MANDGPRFLYCCKGVDRTRVGVHGWRDGRTKQCLDSDSVLACGDGAVPVNTCDVSGGQNISYHFFLPPSRRAVGSSKGREACLGQNVTIVLRVGPRSARCGAV